MASMLDSDQHAKRLHVFRNGDPGFLGKDVTVSRRNARNWDSFLQNITGDVKATAGVREICTPVGGTVVTNYDQLIDRESYVAVSRGKFKDIGYMTLEVQQRQYNAPPVHSRSTEEVKTLNRGRVQAKGRIYETSTNSDVISIFVYSNGDVLQPPRRVTIPRRLMDSLDHVLQEVNEHVKLNSGAARLLYTVDGQLIYEPSQQLENKANYVAVGSEFGGFKRLNYGNNNKPAFITYSNNRKRPEVTRKSLQPAPTNNSSSTSASSTIPADVWRFQRQTRSHDELATDRQQQQLPVARNKGLRHSVEGDRPSVRHDGPFYAKPVTHRMNGGKTVYRDVDYDRDEGGIFKSKRTYYHDTADEVQDSYETRVDLPVDQRRAEEVEEEEDDYVNYRRQMANNMTNKYKQQQKKDAGITQRQSRPTQKQQQQQPLQQQHGSVSPTRRTHQPPAAVRPSPSPVTSTPRSNAGEDVQQSDNNHLRPNEVTRFPGKVKRPPDNSVNHKSMQQNQQHDQQQQLDSNRSNKFREDVEDEVEHGTGAMSERTKPGKGFINQRKLKETTNNGEQQQQLDGKEQPGDVATHGKRKVLQGGAAGAGDRLVYEEKINENIVENVERVGRKKEMAATRGKLSHMEQEQEEDQTRDHDEITNQQNDQVTKPKNYEKPWRQRKAEKDALMAHGTTKQQQQRQQETDETGPSREESEEPPQPATKTKDKGQKPWKQRKVERVAVDDDDVEREELEQEAETSTERQKISKQRQIKRTNATVNGISGKHESDNEQEVEEMEGKMVNQRRGVKGKVAATEKYVEDEEETRRDKLTKVPRKPTGMTDKTTKRRQTEQEEEDGYDEYESEEIVEWKANESRRKTKAEQFTDNKRTDKKTTTTTTSTVANRKQKLQRKPTNNEYTDEEETAAVQIQKTFRGYQVRNNLRYNEQ